MKLSRFVQGLNSGLKNLLNFMKRVKSAVAAPKKKVHLSYLRLTSSVANVRFAAEASAASFRRNHRDQILKAIRRNTRGNPVGLPRVGTMRKCDVKKWGKVLRFDPLTKTWNLETPMRVEQSLAFAEALKVGAEYRAQKPSKLARRVQGGKRVRSCSAMRSMVAIMERRELLAGRA